MENTYKIKKEEVIGKNILDMVPNLVKEGFDKWIKEVIKTGESFELENWEHETLRIGKRIINLKISPLHNEEGGVIGATIIFDDVTEKVKLQKKLEKAYQDFKELDKMRREFINVIAHELRTPLSVIKGYLSILELDKEKNLTEKQKKFLDIMDKNADILNKLISDILDLLKIDSGMVELRIDALNLEQIVKSIVKDFMPDLNKNKQTLDLEIPENLIIEGDEQKITQIFSNLISNAIKYTPDNGKICIKIEERENDIIVKISDSGIGIPESDLDKIFDRFYIVDTTLARESDRVGLGLSIVKGNVELHGGSITVKSKLREGSTFEFTLPKRVSRLN
ncbi:MAG TPA: PAS domain S-box protein [Methanosarcinales archaeon]|nr:PAS domain S-box protein [Methanosarcinales archaeon]